MKIRNTAGRLFTPGVISDIPTGNLVWVDAVNGNDDLAVREGMTVPCKTLAKAKALAISGDTVVVLPGTYNANDLAKNGVNWHFTAGAVVDFSSTGNTGIFDTNSVGSACQFKVTGHGVFKTTNGSYTASILYLNRSGDYVEMEFDSVQCNNGIAFRCEMGTGGVLLRGNTAQSGDKVLNFTGGGRRIVHIREVICTAATAVSINGTLTAEINADLIISEGGHGVHFLAASTASISAFEIQSQTSHGVHYDSSGSDPLHLRVGRIVSTYANASGQAVYVDQGTDNLFLYGCVLVATSTAVKTIDADAATNVVAMGPCVGNQGKGSNVTFVASTYTQSTLVA